MYCQIYILHIRLCEALVLTKLNYGLTVYGSCMLARSQHSVLRMHVLVSAFMYHLAHMSNST